MRNDYYKLGMKKKKKSPFLPAFILLVIIVLAAVVGNQEKLYEKKYAENSFSQSAERASQTSNKFEANTAEKESEIAPIPENIIEIDYVLLVNNYTDEKYKNKWVKIIGKVSKKSFMKPIYFADNLEKGSVSITEGNGKESTSDRYTEGEYICVIGFVDSKSMMGELMIINAIIEKATENEIKKTNEYSDIRNRLEIQTENNYKKGALVVDYDGLIRRPDDYKGKTIKITVKITQIFGNSGLFEFLYEKGYAGKQDNNEWIIKYELPEGASRIIEGDIVTFYGEYDGLQERERTIGGNKAYIPHLTAKYHGSASN